MTSIILHSIILQVLADCFNEKDRLQGRFDIVVDLSILPNINPQKWYH